MPSVKLILCQGKRKIYLKSQIHTTLSLKRSLAPQYLADQLTLFHLGRADYPHLLLLALPIFFTFRHHWACAGPPERTIGTLGLPPCSTKRLYPHQKFGHPGGPDYCDIFRFTWSVRWPYLLSEDNLHPFSKLRQFAELVHNVPLLDNVRLSWLDDAIPERSQKFA